MYEQTLADLLANGTTARDAKNEAKQIADEAMAAQREARARRRQETAEQKNAADEALVARLPLPKKPPKPDLRHVKVKKKIVERIEDHRIKMVEYAALKEAYDAERVARRQAQKRVASRASHERDRKRRLPVASGIHAGERWSFDAAGERHAAGATWRYWMLWEHELFFEGVHRYGCRDNKSIARHVGTRTPMQVRAFKQKILKKCCPPRCPHCSKDLTRWPESAGRRHIDQECPERTTPFNYEAALLAFAHNRAVRRSSERGPTPWSSYSSAVRARDSSPDRRCVYSYRGTWRLLCE